MADRLVAAIHVAVYRPEGTKADWSPDATIRHLAREIRSHFGKGAFVRYGPKPYEARIVFTPRRWATDLLPGLKRVSGDISTGGARVAIGLIAQREK